MTCSAGSHPLPGGDLSAAEPARVLRVPRTLNVKYDPPRHVTIEVLTGQRYDVHALEALLPLAEAVVMPADRPEPGAPIGEGGRNAELYRIARAMALKGLTRAAVLEENRQRCRPPLPEGEVRAMVEHTVTQPRRSDFGQTVAAPTPRALLARKHIHPWLHVDDAGVVVGRVTDAGAMQWLTSTPRAALDAAAVEQALALKPRPLDALAGRWGDAAVEAWLATGEPPALSEALALLIREFRAAVEFPR